MAAHAMAAARPSCAAPLVSMCRGAERGLVLETAQACSVVVPGWQDQPGACDGHFQLHSFEVEAAVCGPCVFAAGLFSRDDALKIKKKN